MPLITVAICTRDRSDRLRKVLDSLAVQKAPPSADWELLIVDNGSQRDTRKLVDGYAGALPIRFEHEPRAGLSHARNRSLDTARGDWIVFTDDDVTVPPTWLSAYADAFETHSAASFFGGPIRAEIDGMSDARLAPYREHVGGALVHLEPGFGLCYQFRAGWGFPWGANMAFRHRELAGLRFDPRLGRKPGGGFQTGEETQLIGTLLAAGKFGVWLPGNGVVHHTDRSRLRASYLRRFYHEVGWLLGEDRALSDASGRAADDLRQIEHRLRLHRRLVVPFAMPLAERLVALRDRALDRGFLDGFRATENSLQRSSAVQARKVSHA